MGGHFYFLKDHTNPLSQFWEESWHNREAFTESLMGFGGAETVLNIPAQNLLMPRF